MSKAVHYFNTSYFLLIGTALLLPLLLYFQCDDSSKERQVTAKVSTLFSKLVFSIDSTALVSVCRFVFHRNTAYRVKLGFFSPKEQNICQQEKHRSLRRIATPRGQVPVITTHWHSVHDVT